MFYRRDTSTPIFAVWNMSHSTCTAMDRNHLVTVSTTSRFYCPRPLLRHPESKQHTSLHKLPLHSFTCHHQPFLSSIILSCPIPFTMLTHLSSTAHHVHYLLQCCLAVGGMPVKSFLLRTSTNSTSVHERCLACWPDVFLSYVTVGIYLPTNPFEVDARFPQCIHEASP